MKTRDIIKALTKNQVEYTGFSGPLAERAKDYLSQYNTRETNLVNKRSAAHINIPMIESLRKRINKYTNTIDNKLPICMKFDAYQVIKTASNKFPNDRGIMQASRHLEKVWTDDPMGNLTAGDLGNIRSHFSASFPRSKISTIIDSEIGKVGFNKLPVAKLARMATNINSQEEFDAIVKASNLDGNNHNQIQSRNLIRALVEMRGDKVILNKEAALDNRSLSDKIADTLTREAQLTKAEPGLEPPPDMGMTDLFPEEAPIELDSPVDEPMLDDEMSSMDSASDPSTIVPMIEEVDNIVEDTAPEEAEAFIQQELAEGQSMPGTAEWGFEEAEEGHSAPPPSKEWQEEELAEHNLGGPPMDNIELSDNLDEPPSDSIEEMLQEPTMATANKQASGLDAPTPPSDGQYDRRDNSAPDRSKNGGSELTKDESAHKAFSMSHEDVEASLLDKGIPVSHGSLTILINANDEVELWDKDAGLACELHDIDVAINDFISKAAAYDKSLEPKGSYSIVEIVAVPCAKCAALDYFESTADIKDIFACGKCGYNTKAATVIDLVKQGQLGRQFSISLEMPTHVVRSPEAKRIFNQLVRRIEGSIHNASVYQRGPTEFEIIVSDEDSVRKIGSMLKQMGVYEYSHTRRGQFDPGSVTAPGSADMPIQQEVVPQGGNTIQPAPQGGNTAPPMSATNPAASQPAAGLTSEDIAAAFKHYHSMGLHFPEAVSQFTKDYKDKMDSWTEQMNAELVNIASQLYGGLPSGQMMAATAKLKHAFKDPKVHAQQPSKVNVQKKVLGPFSDDKDPGRMDAPKPKKSGDTPKAGDQSGTSAVPKDMGKQMETKDPGRFKAGKPKTNGHVPKAGDQPGTAPTSNKDLGKDSEHGKKTIPTPTTKLPNRPKL